MFQVDPTKHRLLLEVFDENRLVSYLVKFNLSVYNFECTENLGWSLLCWTRFSFELLQFCLILSTQSIKVHLDVH